MIVTWRKVSVVAMYLGLFAAIASHFIASPVYRRAAQHTAEILWLIGFTSLVIRWGYLKMTTRRRTVAKKSPEERKALFRYFTYASFQSLNPALLLQNFRMLIGEFSVAKDRIRDEGSRVDVYVQFPLRGNWYIHKGGVTKANSHSWELLAQRYAYDIVGADDVGKSRLAIRRIEDYQAFRAPVLSPVTGTVVEVRDGIRDYYYRQWGQVDCLTPDLRGNYVLIRFNGGYYILLAHLLKGSITVKLTETVQAGAVIGKVGNSGNSTEPHLHIHVQDAKSFYRSMSVPFGFRNIAVKRIGSAVEACAVVKTGDFVVDAR